jgi:tetratricopeptide (TPR) repeat protein
VILSLLAAAAAAVQAASPIDAAEARFRACAETARADPQAGVEAANAWLVESGALHARQCLGLAYVGLERWAPAATVYEQAAEAAGPGDPRAADFLVQAGNAWLAGGESTRAVEALDRALATTHLTDELRGEVHLDRARALVALGNAEGARGDLDRGLALVPADPFGWYLSAALAQRQGDLARARADIGRARERAPDDPDVLLLAGTIAGLSGDMDEAERLYRRVAALAPNSPAGRTARESLPVEESAPEEPPQSR